MKHIFISAAGLLLMVGAGVALADDLKQGARLPKAKLQSMTQQVVTIGNKVLHVVGQTSDGATLVANPLGAVGRCNNDVLVSGASPADVKSRVASIGLPAVEQHYYEVTGLSRLRFANISAAAEAQSALATAFPGAAISVPVEYTQRSPR